MPFEGIRDCSNQSGGRSAVFLCVIGYSEIPDRVLSAKDPEHLVLYTYANMCHMLYLFVSLLDQLGGLRGSDLNKAFVKEDLSHPFGRVNLD